MQFGLGVQHELRQGPVQPGHLAAQKAETRTAQLGPSLEIQAQWRAKVDMVARLEIEAGRFSPGRAPTPHLDVAGLVNADRNSFMRQVGQAHQDLVEQVLNRIESLGTGLEQVGNTADLGQQRAGIPTLALEHSDLFGQTIALRLHGLRLYLQAATLAFKRLVAFDIEKGLRVLALIQSIDNGVEVLAQQANVKHLQSLVFYSMQSRRRRPAKPEPLQELAGSASAIALSPRPLGKGKRTCSSTPGRLRTEVAPSARSWLMTA